jgi:hypothetical protein
MGGFGAGGVVVPGGGLSAGLLYQTQVGIGIGAGGLCAGGSAKAEKDSNETRAAFLCAGSALVDWVMPTAKYAPLLGLNASYAYAGYVAPDQTVGRFSGGGAMLSARAGALIERRWLVALRVDLPLFSMALEQDPSRTHRLVAFITEFGFRFPSR